MKDSALVSSSGDQKGTSLSLPTANLSPGALSSGAKRSPPTDEKDNQIGGSPDSPNKLKRAATLHFKVDENPAESAPSQAEYSEDQEVDIFDVLRSYCKTEAVEKLVEGVRNHCDEKMNEVIKKFETAQQERMEVLEQRCQATVDSIQSTVEQNVWAKMQPVREDIEAILKNKQREKSDLQLMNAKLIEGIEQLAAQA